MFPVFTLKVVEVVLITVVQIYVTALCRYHSSITVDKLKVSEIKDHEYG